MDPWTRMRWRRRWQRLRPLIMATVLAAIVVLILLLLVQHLNGGVSEPLFATPLEVGTQPVDRDRPIEFEGLAEARKGREARMEELSDALQRSMWQQAFP